MSAHSEALRAAVGSLPYLLASSLQLACLAAAAPRLPSSFLLPYFLLASLPVQPQSSLFDPSPSSMLMGTPTPQLLAASSILPEQ